MIPIAWDGSRRRWRTCRLDEQGEVIWLTIVNAKWLLGQEGKITITVPSLIEPDADDLAAVLAAA